MQTSAEGSTAFLCLISCCLLVLRLEVKTLGCSTSCVSNPRIWSSRRKSDGLSAGLTGLSIPVAFEIRRPHNHMHAAYVLLSQQWTKTMFKVQGSLQPYTEVRSEAHCSSKAKVLRANIQFTTCDNRQHKVHVQCANKSCTVLPATYIYNIN